MVNQYAAFQLLRPECREAQLAADDTFFFTNSCLQHENLNQDEWLALEDWVKELDLDADGRITEFTGPIYGDHARSITPDGEPTALIPSAFFKVVCFKNKRTESLDVRAFIIYQDEAALKDKNGKIVFNNQTYQVTISEIEQLTGLVFCRSIYEANPLYFYESDITRDLNISHLPERHEVSSSNELVTHDRRVTEMDDVVDVYISAAMADLRGTGLNKEWVSIINLDSDSYDLGAWSIGTTHAHKIKISSLIGSGAATVEPGESIVLRSNGEFSLPNRKTCVIFLWNEKVERIDRVSYTKDMVVAGKPILFLSPRDTLNK